MTAVTSPTVARKKAREHAAKLLEADDAERRRLEGERRKRVAEAAADVAGNDAEIEQLTAKVEELRADSVRKLAAIVADGVSETKTAEMTGRDPREVRAAVRAETKVSAAAKAPAAKKAASTRTAASPAAA
ncbi:hypothetical protein GCM10009839_89010 [Catenulispora yoronensis]|uniref:Integration host factor n=1 Tax=Catenulispora yoronensis TaxID=450799 RepID=A0ABP5H4P8_9ACTN